MSPQIEWIPHEVLRTETSRVKELLSHKPPLAFWLLEEALKTNSQDELKVDAFVAKEDSKWIGSIHVFHFAGIGLVGNVFLKEAYRGRGVGSQLMKAVDDWAKKNKHKVHVLWVDPKKRPAAFSLYKKHGYEPKPDSGVMIRTFSGIPTYDKNSSLSWKPLSWKHYPQLNLLTSLGACDLMVSYLHSCYGHATFEWEFLKCMQDPTESAWAIENEEGLAVGAAFLKKNPLWEQQREVNFENSNYLFDVIIQNDNTHGLAKILPSFSWPYGQVTTYAQTLSPKFEALCSVFKPMLELKNQFTWNKQSHSASLMMKE